MINYIEPTAIEGMDRFGGRLLHVAEYRSPESFAGERVIVVGAGVTALLLSAIGLYAVVAFAVTQRTREIAVRMAVGGRSSSIVGNFVTDGLRLSAYGLAIGLPLSLLGLRALMMIPDAPRVELPHVTLVAALGILIVATLAAWIPARRAASVEPAEILRSE